jgi:pyruvate-ferredoxin/flavodoxin oxidoreductase
VGANQAQAIRAIREAESFPGPSLILAYSPCVAHGYDLKNGPEHQTALVNAGAWPLYRFDPRKIEQGQNPLNIDSGDVTHSLLDFVKTENRFAAAQKKNPAKFEKLIAKAMSDNEYRRELKKHIASFEVRKEKK